MHKFLEKYSDRVHHILAFVFLFLLIVVLFFLSIVAALVALMAFVGLFYYYLRQEQKIRKSYKDQIEAITYRVKKTGDDIISYFPIGIVLYNEQQKVEWCNTTVQKWVGSQDPIGLSLEMLGLGLEQVDLDVSEKQVIKLQDKTYEIQSFKGERLLYITDVTELHSLKETYEREKAAIAIIHMDNYDEVSQGMDDQQRSLLSSQITKIITEWANKHQIFIRRHTSDKFIAFLNQGILNELIQNRFEILDTVRNYVGDNKVPITLSIGVATGVDSLIEMGQLTQASLDIALGRGGDQAAVREGSKLTFYGGKTNAVEKRTRVRARVISHALRDLIRESDCVMIVGHTLPDMDSIGASLGILRAVRMNQREGFVVLDKVNPSISKMLQYIKGNEHISKSLITPEDALMLCTQRTLVVVVDTHRPSMMIAPQLLQICKRVVVIDHHRRAEEFIEDAVLYYMEPYASSTSELVTELLNYQAEKVELDPLEATALLAGIVVDTRSFSYRTGARTFEAASMLRRWGADSMLVQKLLKEDMAHFLRRSQLVSRAEVYFAKIAIATGDEHEIYDQVLVAQAADALLDMDQIEASFVIARRADGQVAISARSLGELNVQVIMEQLGGGGHLTNAATQLKNVTIEEAKEQLLNLLEKNERSDEG